MNDYINYNDFDVETARHETYHNLNLNQLLEPIPVLSLLHSHIAVVIAKLKLNNILCNQESNFYIAAEAEVIRFSKETPLSG